VIAPHEVFRPAPGVETAHFGGELVVLDSAGRMLRGLNGTGAQVWRLLDGQRSVWEVAVALAEQARIDQARALEDVRAFLAALAEKNLVCANDDH
jgi:hypothetical protein